MEDSREIRIYPSRVKALLSAVFCAVMMIFAVLLQFGYLHATSLTNPARLWIYQEPGKTILVLAIVLFSGPCTLFFGYWLCTTEPLLVIDDEGMSYRVPRYERSYTASRVSWRHVEQVEATDDGGWWRGDLLLGITLKEPVTIPLKDSEGVLRKRHEQWHLPHMLLSMRPTRIIIEIEKHCAVQMEGAHRSQP